MQLIFEISKEVDSALFPDLIHFENEQAQVFDIQAGRLLGRETPRIRMGEWGEHFQIENIMDVSPDDNMSNLEVNAMSGFGIVGSYKTPFNSKTDIHKLLIHEFAYELDKYLESGSISQTLDNPINSFNLSLNNPDMNNPERPGNIIIGENNASAIPGSKINFMFGLGDIVEPSFHMGEFYVDNSKYTMLAETASVDGRNLIGKALRDQTVDENNKFEESYLHETLAKLLRDANLTNDQYLIQPSSYHSAWEIKPNTSVKNAIESILNVGEPDWIVKELEDGVIVIGEPSYIWFDNPGTHLLIREKDVFSRSISYDDMNSYSKVCVHDSDFNIAEYVEVSGVSGWNIQANRTLYVPMPEGVTSVEANSYAQELAEQLKTAGKLESFTGPFRPHIQPGDAVNITSDTSVNDLGLVTDVTHNFGASGYTTNFTVDSGGVIGKGRIGDFIKAIVSSNKDSSSSGVKKI